MIFLRKREESRVLSKIGMSCHLLALWRRGAAALALSSVLLAFSF